MNFIKRIFTGMKQEPEEPVIEESSVTEEIETSPVAEEAAQTEAEPSFPDVRRVLQIPVISEGVFPEGSDEVLIKAQPSPTGDQCLFTVNRSLMTGHSWYFADFESAEGSSLAERLFFEVPFLMFNVLPKLELF